MTTDGSSFHVVRLDDLRWVSSWRFPHTISNPGRTSSSNFIAIHPGTSSTESLNDLRHAPHSSTPSTESCHPRSHPRQTLKPSEEQLADHRTHSRSVSSTFLERVREESLRQSGGRKETNRQSVCSRTSHEPCGTWRFWIGDKIRRCSSELLHSDRGRGFESHLPLFVKSGSSSVGRALNFGRLFLRSFSNTPDGAGQSYFQ